MLWVNQQLGKKKNNNNNKNNRLLKTKSSIIDSKRFSRNQSVSADYVFLLKTLHIQHLGDFFLIQAAVLSFTSNFVATAIAALCYCPAPLFTLTDLLYRKHRLSSAGSKVLSSWFQANKLSINIKRSNFISFKTKQNRQKLDWHFSINDSEIDRINELLFLGVILDEHLSW